LDRSTRKAAALLSGGLDSTVAIQLMLDQGVEVAALNFVTTFCCCTPKTSSCSAARTAVRQLGVHLDVVNVTEEFLRVVEKPRHGYGSGMNPCLDCRILMFRKAREYMEAAGASFVVTGEVLGQRPMSQYRAAMKLIEAESGLAGLVVRPLSAALLEPSIPERRGWIDRGRLLSLSGRSRRPQTALAEELGIRDYPCPAGGCLLTDKVFAARVSDLLEHNGKLTVHDVSLLKVGRHFRLSDRVKLVVGRNQQENRRIDDLVREGDTVLETVCVPGAVVLVRGSAGTRELEEAAAIAARYSKARDVTTVRVMRHGAGSPEHVALDAAPIGDLDLAARRIGGNVRRPRGSGDARPK
jgi:tRNA-specific 2-thiouridylase